MASSTPEILLVGASGSGKWALQAALIARTTDAPSPSSSEAQTARQIVSWHIDNKYYSVDTRLRVVAAEGAVCDLAHAPASSQPEAVLLVINSTQPESLAAVQSWNEAHNPEDAGVRLVVATHADRLVEPASQGSLAADELEPVRPAWLEQAMDWSSEQQFEYVECCCTDASLDARLRLFGDVQGMERIVAALHAHMWPGLIRKPTLPATTARSTTSTTASEHPEQGEQQHITSLHPAQLDTQHHSQFQRTNAGNGKKQHTDDSGEQERQVEAYDRLMEDMAAAKQRLHTCDDDTRRAQAAELALRFASLLCGDDDTEDSAVPSDASDAEK